MLLRLSTDLVEEGLGIGYHGGYCHRGVKHHHAGPGIHSLVQTLQMFQRDGQNKAAIPERRGYRIL